MGNQPDLFRRDHGCDGEILRSGRGRKRADFLTDDLFSQEAKSYRSCKREVLNWCNEKKRTEEGGVQVFMPLHYQLHRMGYCMVAGVDEMFRTGILETFSAISVMHWKIISSGSSIRK